MGTTFHVPIAPSAKNSASTAASLSTYAMAKKMKSTITRCPCMSPAASPTAFFRNRTTSNRERSSALRSPWRLRRSARRHSQHDAWVRASLAGLLR